MKLWRLIAKGEMGDLEARISGHIIDDIVKECQVCGRDFEPVGSMIVEQSAPIVNKH